MNAPVPKTPGEPISEAELARLEDEYPATSWGLLPRLVASLRGARNGVPTFDAVREHAQRPHECRACGDFRSGREEVVTFRPLGMPPGGSTSTPPLVFCLQCARRIGDAAKVRR